MMRTIAVGNFFPAPLSPEATVRSRPMNTPPMSPQSDRSIRAIIAAVVRR
jgi:hypothetical protein